ncbi:MAG: nucleotidyl transferase AbiEii/AbiGii toxin family protein, partial [Pseudonocardia sp.]|nr:nucleotidyl transferase AbiEii/AbiGii toxin family protein [Pseudonocardia sp.]
MSGKMPDHAAAQREVAALLLSVIGGDGFALAGAGAIREHALTDRPTADIDLFGMPLTTAEQFANVVERAETTLVDGGYMVVRARSFAQFARLHLSKDGVDVLDVDLALNWRADPPVQMSVGPVLSERDAIAGKLSAVYSRGEVRDFLDLDAIRSSGRYSDAELLDLGREHDDGFHTAMFAAQLSRVIKFLPSEAA